MAFCRPDKRPTYLRRGAAEDRLGRVGFSLLVLHTVMKLANRCPSKLVVTAIATCLAGCAETRQELATDSLPAAAAADTIRGDLSSGPVASEASARLPPAPDTFRLAMPRILPNFCEGEGCSFGHSLVACAALTLRAADASTAPEVGRVAPGDTVRVETGNLYVHAPGIAVMRRAAVVAYDTVPYGDGNPIEDRMRLAAGDTVRFLEYYGEGSWGVVHNGRVVIVKEFWPRFGFPSRWDEGKPATTLSVPEVTQWLRLQSPHGSRGWWHEESSRTVRPDWNERCAPTS